MPLTGRQDAQISIAHVRLQDNCMDVPGSELAGWKSLWAPG